MLLKVNGRTRFFEYLANLKRVSKSTWTVERLGTEFRIEGGYHAGGRRNEWFLDGPLFPGGSIHCTSLMDALNELDKC